MKAWFNLALGLVVGAIMCWMTGDWAQFTAYVALSVAMSASVDANKEEA